MTIIYYIPLCVITNLLARTNQQTTQPTTTNYDSVDEAGYELIEEDLLRLHSSSDVTYHSLWNRVGFNGFDKDNNRRRDIIDEWDEFPPIIVHFLYCESGQPLCDEDNFALKITIDVEKNSIRGNVSEWGNVDCSAVLYVPRERSFTSIKCSFQDPIYVKAGDINVTKTAMDYEVQISASSNPHKTGFLVVASIYNETVCPCDCVYHEKVEAAKNQTREKKSMSELREELAPQLQEMQKNLSVDTSQLSSYINKKISKDDKRKTSKQIGMVGVIFLVIELSALVLVDLLSFRRHLDMFRDNWNRILERFQVFRNFQL